MLSLNKIGMKIRSIILKWHGLLQNDYKLIGGGEPKIGAHGKPVIFLHPSDFNGTLIELQQE